MKLRDCLAPLNALFVMRDSALSQAIQGEFAKDLNCLKIFVNDDESALSTCYKESYDIVLVEIETTRDLYVIEEARYANPRLEFIIISDSDLDLLILQCFKCCIFAYLHKSSFFAPIANAPHTSPSHYNMRELEIILAHFSLLAKSCEVVYISKRIAIECANEAIYIDNKQIYLSPKLKKIFWLLYVNRNRLVPYERILSSVFDMESTIDSLRMSIVRLKKLLKDDTIIINISGEGYMLVCDSNTQERGQNGGGGADLSGGGGECPFTKNRLNR